MKCFKKFFIFLLALAVLCGSSVVHISAAENQIMSTNAIAAQDVWVGNVHATFYFEYSDGNSAKLLHIMIYNDNYFVAEPPTFYFS